MPTVVRPAAAGDAAYLAKTLAGCLRETALGRGAEWPALAREAERMFAGWRDEGGRVLVACDSEDEDAIVGYAVGAPPTLHHVYVRAEFRGAGVARQLLAELGPCSRYTLPPSRKTSLTRRLSYAPRLTVGMREARR